MFWSNAEGSKKIMRADMDGRNFMPILQSDLKVVQGLAIDQGGSRLYWIDTKFDKLESCLLDGKDRRVIIAGSGRRLLTDAFIIDVFGDQVFWANSKTDAVFVRKLKNSIEKFRSVRNCTNFFIYFAQSAEKFSGNNIVTHFVNQARGKLRKGKLVHIANQPISILNPCDDTGCSHICVTSPSSLLQFRCLCPVGMHLDHRDERTCIGKSFFMPQVVKLRNNSRFEMSLYKMCGVSDTPEFPRLAIANENTINILAIGSVGKSLTENIPVPGVRYIQELIYNYINNSLIIRSFSKLYEFKLDGKSLQSISTDEDLPWIVKMEIGW